MLHRIDKRSLFFLLSIIAVGICIIRIRGDISPSPDAFHVVAEDCQDLFPQSMVFLDEIGAGNFTSTGMTFDSVNHSFWIADHGSSAGDVLRMMELDNTMDHVLSVVQISDYQNDGNTNLQGIAYDRFDDAIWIAVGDRIQQVTKTGEIIKTISLGKYKNCSANGICIDETDGTIWVLCYYDYLSALQSKRKDYGSS